MLSYRGKTATTFWKSKFARTEQRGEQTKLTKIQKREIFVKRKYIVDIWQTPSLDLFTLLFFKAGLSCIGQTVQHGEISPGAGVLTGQPTQRLHGVVWYCMVMYGIAWHCMALYSIVWYCNTICMVLLLLGSLCQDCASQQLSK